MLSRNLNFTLDKVMFIYTLSASNRWPTLLQWYAQSIKSAAYRFVKLQFHAFRAYLPSCPVFARFRVIFLTAKASPTSLFQLFSLLYQYRPEDTHCYMSDVLQCTISSTRAIWKQSQSIEWIMEAEAYVKMYQLFLKITVPGISENPDIGNTRFTTFVPNKHKPLSTD